MSKFRSARAVLAGAAVIALAGCGASASTSGPSGSSSGGISSGGSPSAASSSSPSGTPSATSNSFVSAGSIPFPIAVGNTWVYQAVSGIDHAQSLVTNRVLSVATVPGGHRVTMSETISGTPAKTTQETYIFYANGTIGYPVNEASGVSVAGNGVLWPDAADLASGQDYHSVLHVRVGNTGPA